MLPTYHCDEAGSTFSCPAFHHPRIPPAPCGLSPCEPADCCRPNDRCGAFKCPPDTKVTDVGKYCASARCTADECCRPLPPGTCEGVTCPAFHHPLTNPGLCGPGQDCQAEDCCALNDRCSEQGVTCEHGHRFDPTAVDRVCQGPTCEASECCERLIEGGFGG